MVIITVLTTVSDSASYNVTVHSVVIMVKRLSHVGNFHHRYCKTGGLMITDMVDTCCCS
jgi:hypothetical protein